MNLFASRLQHYDRYPKIMHKRVIIRKHTRYFFEKFKLHKKDLSLGPMGK